MAEERGGNERKCGSRGLEGGSAEEGECMRASGNPRRSYIFLQERLSDYAIALRYAITRIYWYIIPRGLGERRDRCAAYTQIRNRYAVPFVDVFSQ